MDIYIKLRPYNHEWGRFSIVSLIRSNFSLIQQNLGAHDRTR
jgi:hypothetical protein